jgi:signal transduction histidine kinase
MRDAELAPLTIDPALAFLAGGGEMGGLIRRHDWESTPLGPAALWPQSLKTAVRIMLSSRQPIWIGWGRPLTYLYNDAYQSIIGGKHPRALGRPTEEVWREIWGEIGPMLDTAMGGVEGTYVEEQLLIMERNGYPEETYYTYSYTPIPDDDGTPGGIICANTDDTQRVIGERQLALLRDVSAKTADARSWREVCERGAGALAGDPRDLTFALLYMAEPTEGAATLAAATGLRPGHPAAPASLPLAPGAPWPVGEVIADHDLRLVEEPAAWFGDGLPGGAWERPTTQVAVLALPASGEAGRAGALVVGLNPFRLFDQGYRSFLGLVAGQIAAAVANAVAFEEERRRAEALAEAKKLVEEKQAALEDQTNALEILNRASAAISGDLDLERLVQTVTDAAVELTGAEFGAFFYNVVDADGERYTLYTLSGAERSAFAAYPMPRNTAVFGPTFTGEGVVRSDDITQDPRYGRSAPHYGMPKGHLPVCSYLAVPVRSRSGEVLGGLFFGHSRPGVFDPLSEERIVGLASHAAVAMDNARLFQAAERELEQRRRAEAELQALNAGLEGRVAAEVAERNKAEDALRQAQKMEAVGQLTGGVAHDFNNLLTVIIGGLDSIKRSRPSDEARIRRAADMALQGAQRAASLTGRLLAFSRRQPLDPRPLDLNQRVRDMTELLHRTLGEQVELEGVLAPRLWRIEADQNQLESAILNLAVNARDAMPEGGKLTIETANTALDESYVAVDAEVVPGQYVVIAVSDSGCGMSKEIQAKVFEPFFTTKEVGRGTGLGLSMVYGFVKQSGGHVTVYSEEGQGTTVKLYFPRFVGAAAIEAAAGEAALPLGSDQEVILVVEDNDAVRANSIMSLQELGYQVVEASEADSALEIVRSAQRIDLLFTDVVLPGKSGRMLADAARTLRPELKVLFTTGYSRNAIVHHGRLDPGVRLLSKPFTFEQLATRVRDMLDRG